MDYSEASFFDGAHFAHIATWQDYNRKLRLAKARTDPCRSRSPKGDNIIPFDGERVTCSPDCYQSEVECGSFMMVG
jgi:hypothetical protein